MRASTLIRALGAACALAALTGCISATREFDVEARPVPAPKGIPRVVHEQPGDKLCTVYLATIRDARLDPESVGHGGSQGYIAKNVAAGFEKALRETLQTRVSLGADETSADLVVEPVLQKCYLSHVDITKIAVVVVEIVFQAKERPDEHRFYRGRLTGMNWWNSDAELTGALQEAFKECLLQVSADVQRHAETWSKSSARTETSIGTH